MASYSPGSSERSVGARLRKLRDGIYGTLQVLQKKETPRKPWLVYLLFTVTFFQSLHFVTAFPAGFVWPGRTVFQVAGLISFSSPSSYFASLRSTPGSLEAFFYASIVWVASFLALFAWSVYCFISKKWPVLWPLQALRLIGTLSSHVLFIPLLTVLLKGLACGSTDPTNLSVFTSCSDPSYTASLPVVAILAPLFVLLCSLFTLVYHDANPLSLSAEARAHGRMDFALLISRTLMVVFIDIFPGLLSPWANLAVCAAAGALWVGTAVYLLPYYNATMNRLNIAYATSFTWSVCCLALSLGRSDLDVGVQLFMSLPLSMLAGLYLHDSQVLRIQRSTVDRLSSPYEVEIKTRYLIHTALYGHATDKLFSIVDRAGGGDVELGGEAASSRLRHSAGGKAAAGASATAALRAGSGGSGGGGGGGGGSGLESGPGEDTDEALDWISAVRDVFPAEAQAQVLATYKAGLQRFRNSSMLHVFLARFYLTLLGNRHMQMSHLLQAERMQPPLDVSYVVFQARKAAEDSGGAQLSALARVTYEKYLQDSKRSVRRAGLKQVAFFNELVNPLPDLMRLHKLSSEMNGAIEESERSFAELFALDPQSVVSMRLSSAFNEYVLCNSEKAALLTQEAERIDEHRIKEHQGEGRSAQAFMSASALDVNGETTAVFTVASSPRHFGLIIQANTAAAKLFGYLRLQLERRSLFSLFPRPLADFFEGLLAQYMATGEGELSTTRVTYALNKNGTSMPVLFSIREAPPGDGPPTFVAFVRPLAAPEQHVLLEGPEHMIVGASMSAMLALGIDSPSLLALGSIGIRELIPGWEAALPALSSSGGELVSIVTQGEEREVEEREEREGEGEGEGSSSGQETGGEETSSITGVGEEEEEEEEGEGEEGQAVAATAARATPRPRLSRTPGSAAAAAAASSQALLPGSKSTIVRAHLETFQPPGDRPAVHLLRFQHPSSTDMLKISLRGGRGSLAAVRALSTSTRRTSTMAASAAAAAAAAAAASGKKPKGSASSSRSPRGGSAARAAAAAALPPLSPSPAAVAASEEDMLFPAEEAAASAAAAEHPPPPSQPPPASLGASRSAVAEVLSVQQQQQQQQQQLGGAGGAELPAFGSPLPGQPLSPTASHATTTSKRVRLQGALKHSQPEGSVHKSESSGASSTRKNAGRLRRLLTSPTQPLLYGLSLLRIVGILVSLLAIVLATVVALQTQGSFESYNSNLVYTLNGGMRITTNFNLVLCLQALVLNAKGYLPIPPAEEAAMRAALVANASQLQALQNAAYSYIQTTPSAGVYTEPTVTVIVYDSAQGGPDGTPVLINLQDGIDLFVSLATVAANQSNAELADDDNPAVRFMQVNCISGGKLHETMSATLGSGFDLSLTAAAVLQAGQNYVFWAMMSLLGFITLAGFLPIVYIVQRSKDGLTASFAGMPHLVRLLLQHSVLRRYKRLQSSVSDEAGENDQEEDFFEGEGGVAGQGGAASATGGIEALYEAFLLKDAEGGVREGEELDWGRVMSAAANRDAKVQRRALRRGSDGESVRGLASRLLCCCCAGTRVAPDSASASATAGKAGKSTYTSADAPAAGAVRRSTLPFFALLLKFTLPMLALFAYYLTLYFQSTAILKQVLGLQAALVGSSNRHACSRELLVDLQRDMWVYGDRDFMRTRYATMVDTQECVLYHEAELQYGAAAGLESRGTYSDYMPALETGQVSYFTASENAQLYTAQHGDACEFIAGSADPFGAFGQTVWPGSVEQCRSFSSGLLRTGLTASIKTYVNNIDRLSLKRMRARLYSVPHAARAGLGALLPVASYNFSEDEGTWAGAANTLTLAGAGAGLDPPPFPPHDFSGDIDNATAFWASAPKGTLNYSLAAEFLSPEVQWVTQMTRLFITPALVHLTTFYFDKGQATIAALAKFITIFTSAFYCVFISYMVLVYLRQIRQTNHDIVSKKSILLLLPFVVINGVPALQEAVQQIFSEDESSGAKDSGPSSQLAGSYLQDSSEVKDYLAALE